MITIGTIAALTGCGGTGTDFDIENMHVVGDAGHVGNLLDVIWKAHDVARSL